MGESIHKRLERVRKPHVHITYDVEIGDAREVKELPFVMGVMGDFSGNPLTPLAPLTDRKFIQIDRDNFNEVMARIAPELNIRVENTMLDDGSELALQLKFKSMDDLEPVNLINQVEPLRKIFETRNKLNELLMYADQSRDLENAMNEVLKNSEAQGTAAPQSEPKKEGE